MQNLVLEFYKNALERSVEVTELLLKIFVVFEALGKINQNKLGIKWMSC